MKAAAVALALVLTGCAALPVAGAGAAGGAAGWFAAAQADLHAADELLAADAPAKRYMCSLELKKPHSKTAQAFFDTYCANIPTNVGEAINTWAKVYVAVSLADQQ